MAEINGTAGRYRQRAEDLRVSADAKGATEIREQLLDLAAVYERLAQEVEDIDASNRESDFTAEPPKPR
jgi:hypothetical protein